MLLVFCPVLIVVPSPASRRIEHDPEQEDKQQSQDNRLYIHTPYDKSSVMRRKPAAAARLRPLPDS